MADLMEGAVLLLDTLHVHSCMSCIPGISCHELAYDIDLFWTCIPGISFHELAYDIGLC
jgi:hypothetical protein